MNWLVDPVDWWITPFTDNPFLRDALWAALLSVCCTSVIGTWVVLRGLSFLDSSGINMLVAARRSAERRRRAVSLIRGPRHVQRVLRLTGTESLFTFVAAEGDG